MLVSHKQPPKSGSVPMVLVIGIVVGTLAMTSLFSSTSTARMDKKAQLREVAKNVAQTAVEEILVKISNGTAEWIEKEQTGSTAYKKNVYTPYVTRYLIERAYAGAKVDNVLVMGRTLEAPAEPAARQAFEEVFTATPAFAKPIEGKPGTGHRKDWFNRLPADLRARYEGDLALRGKGVAYHDKYFEVDKTGVSKLRPEEKALKDIDRRIIVDGRVLGNEPGKGIGEALAELRPVSEIGVAAFKSLWDVAMTRIVQRVEMRFQGCGADQTFILPSTLGAFALGARAESLAPSEMEFRNNGLAGGAMKYTKNLVTVDARSHVQEGMISASQEMVAHRIVQTTNHKEIMDRFRQKLALYLIANYGFSVAQLESLGWVEGQGSGFKAKPEILTKLAERFPDVPTPRVYPFQVATGLGEPK